MRRILFLMRVFLLFIVLFGCQKDPKKFIVTEKSKEAVFKDTKPDVEPAIYPHRSEDLVVMSDPRLLCSFKEQGLWRCMGENSGYVLSRDLKAVTNLFPREPFEGVYKNDIAIISITLDTMAMHALLKNGDVICRGSRCPYFRNDKPASQIASLPKLKFMTGQNGLFCGVGMDGKVICWDFSDNNAAPQTKEYLNLKAKDLCVGLDYACAINHTDNVECWGNTDSIYDKTQANRNWKAKKISCGYTFACAITEKDKLVCFGRNDKGQLGRGSVEKDWMKISSSEEVVSLESVQHVASGFDTVCAIANGKMYCWGDGQFGTLADKDTSKHIASKPKQVAFFNESNYPVNVYGSKNAFCAKTNLGGVLCWGKDFGSMPEDMPL